MRRRETAAAYVAVVLMVVVAILMPWAGAAPQVFDGLHPGDPVVLRAQTIGIPTGTPGVVLSASPDGTVRVSMDGFVLETAATCFVLNPVRGKELE